MQIWYMNGAGNDFMVMDARGQQPDFEKLALELCKLTNADGFMAIDHSEKADFKLHFYNSDGSRGEMCGNGARCICRFAYDHGIAGAEMTVETDAGLVPGWRIDENQYRVKLNDPGILDLTRRADCAYVELGCPGVPHGVAEIPGLQWTDKQTLLEKAVALRHAPEFPKGANINFYTLLDDSTVRVLTFERGVEDYTLACGTGCGSVACTLYSQGRLPGRKMTALNEGGTLTVTLSEKDGKITDLYLEGPTEILKTYEL